jgi:hypothetical protein
VNLSLDSLQWHLTATTHVPVRLDRASLQASQRSQNQIISSKAQSFASGSSKRKEKYIPDNLADQF